ncbi:hypothetical protein GFS03_04750 [Sulfolobus sp. E5-1-F]|uniref:hypothetical protein n=1 Tax=Saccharolobus sp. E5-1-F TaxID=2663019 RepID=UPI0012958EF3|nr:hypothetical protein [Sulfolobus sp. E5-1-F]QGA53933.1 hypothetical protein GFS03_04750 [Sulfolobus sp. E5-1-F]
MSKEEKKEKKRFLESIVNLLTVIARGKNYGILDTLAYVSDESIINAALYNAIRYVSTQNSVSIPSERELNILFAKARKNPAIYKELAIRALSRALKQDESEQTPKSEQEEAKQSTQGGGQ